MIDGEEDEVEIELDGDEPEAEGEKPEGEGGDEAAAGENDDEPELIAEVEGDDDDEAGEPEGEKSLENKLRRLLRDREREKITLQRENEALKATAAPKPVEVGPRPDLYEDSDGDQDEHDAKIIAWNKRKEAAEQQERDQVTAKQAAQQRVSDAVQTMRTNATKFGLKNYDDAELAVQQALPPSLAEAIPLLLGDQAPALVQVLHNNPQLIEKINKAVRDDPALGLAAGLVELTRLSMRIKMPVPKRKTGAKAEEIVRGSASLSVVPADKKLAELEKAVDAGKPGAQEALMSFLRGKRKADRAAA